MYPQQVGFEESKLLSLLDNLRKLKSIITVRRKEFDSLRAPIRTLPPEVLLQIFTICARGQEAGNGDDDEIGECEIGIPFNDEDDRDSGDERLSPRPPTFSPVLSLVETVGIFIRKSRR
jgi:hypothetical protein